MNATLSSANFEVCHVARSGFAERFGYVRWLLHLAHGSEPSFTEIADELTRWLKRPKGEEVASQTVSGWAKRDEFPDSRDFARALPAVLGVEEDWLIDGSKPPPRPELWAAWIRARRHPIKRFSIESLVAAAHEPPGSANSNAK
jgi:hypothetical protein